MKRTIMVIITSFLVILLNRCSNNPKDESGTHWIKFLWQGDTLGGKYYDKLAMFVPIRIEGIPYTFRAQLDLGAPSTMIYGNSFKSILQTYPKVAAKLDTFDKPYMIQGKKTGGFKNLTFYLDSVAFKNKDIALFEGFGDFISMDALKKQNTARPTIGTIGLNLFSDNVLLIDFPHNRLAILDSLPDPKDFSRTKIKLEKSRIKIPVQINKETLYVLYDTGSSFSSLFLSTNNWNSLRDTTANLDTIMVSAWGTQYPLYISKTRIHIKIAGIDFKPQVIMGTDLDMYYKFFKRENIIGLMGNQMFFKRMICIDFKNKLFGIGN